MPHRLLVISLDGLATAALAPYGASWCPTPALSRLACQAAVFDRCIVASDDPNRVLEALWSAAAAETPAGSEGDATWLQAATARAVATTLITDSTSAIALPSAGQFANHLLVESQPPSQPCSEIGDTALAQLFAAGIDRLETAGDEGQLLWMHSDVLTRLWDAPRWLVPEPELDDEPWDEPSEEPELLPEHVGPLVAAPRAPKFFSSTTPPQLTLPAGHDPDITLAWMNTYGAQVRLFDALLEVLFEALGDTQPTTLAVVGTSGFALGEHAAIGHGQGPLRSPRIQVPLLIRGPGVPAIRAATPCRPDRLGPTLLESFCSGEGQREGTAEQVERPTMLDAAAKVQSPQPPDVLQVGGAVEAAAQSLLQLVTPQRWSAAAAELEPRIVTRSAFSGSVAQTTPHWLYVLERSGDEHLYSKPDDRADINDVATRLPDVLEQFRQFAS